MNRSDRRANAARLCECGSGKKYKNCHLLIEQEEQATIAAMRQQAETAYAMLPDWGPTR